MLRKGNNQYQGSNIPKDAEFIVQFEDDGRPMLVIVEKPISKKSKN